MAIQEVAATDTPNRGREIWNANDRWLAARLDELAGALARPGEQAAAPVGGHNATLRNVRDQPYSAAGDGLQDDQPAIQAALDDCHSAGGGFVLLPAGTFLLAAPIVLRDGVNLIGAGVSATTLRLAAGVNGPVISDTAAGESGAFAFGRVYLANFTLDGQRRVNPNGGEGIFVTAFYSTFERLEVTECASHGIRMGFGDLVNFSSQNRIIGCRIHHCGGAGILCDIKGIDHTISENYIHTCDSGIVIRNGGVRVQNNGIFRHATHAIRVEQTSYGSLIIGNDFNANRGHCIYVTRTTLAESGPWNQMLIAANSMLADNLDADNTFDAVHVETLVPDGITNLTITGNKVFGLNSDNRYRHGVHLVENVTDTHCYANHIANVAATPYAIGPNCSGIVIDRLGTPLPDAPPLPASDAELVNPFHTAVTIYVRGGAVSDVLIGGVSTGLSSGSFRLGAGQTIRLSYDAPPGWTWIAD